MALELTSGADFGCNRHCKTNPVDLEGLGAKFWLFWVVLGRFGGKTIFHCGQRPATPYLLRTGAARRLSAFHTQKLDWRTHRVFGFVIDFKIGLNFVDVWGPGGPSGAN